MKPGRYVRLRVCLHACVIALLIDLLAFPPHLAASTIATWQGGAGNYSNPASWSCAPACAPPTYPNNGNSGVAGFDAVINSAGIDTVNFDITSTINTMTLGAFGSGNPADHALNINANTLTMGTVSTGGTVLSNGGTLNIGGTGAAVLELSGGGTAQNSGVVGITDGGVLTLRNTAAGASTFTNNGSISVAGSVSAATLQLNDGGSGSTFTLSGTGTLTLSGLGQITGANSTESLVNDVSHTIAGSGTISNLASFTNNGTLSATGGSLVVSPTALANWNAGTATLTGGSYSAGDGATLQLSSIGAGNSIQSLVNATVSLTGSGLLTGDGATNALGGLTNATNSNLTLPSYTLAAGTNGVPASLTLNQGTQMTVSGAFTNSTSTDTLPNSSSLTIQNGSTLTAGSFLNQAQVSFNFQNSNSNVDVLSGSTLNAGSLTTSTNNGFAYSTINITNSTLNVTNDLQHGGSGGNISSGNDTLNLTSATATVGGNFLNNNVLNLSAVNLDNSSLTVTGTFSQTQAANAGSSNLNIANHSTVTVGGLSNSNFAFSADTPDFFEQSQISITNGSALNILGNGTFTNVSAGGVLSGGGYTVGNNSTLSYTGANINTIDANTSITFDNAGGGAVGRILNGGVDAVTNSLATVNGDLIVQNGVGYTVPSSIPVFTVGVNGGLIALNGSTLDLTNTTLSSTNLTSTGVLSSGNYTVGTNSSINYLGSVINTIDVNASVTLDNANAGTTGQILAGGVDALSNSLTNVNGLLTVQSGGSLVLTNTVPSFTVGLNGQVTVDDGGVLDLTSTIFTNVDGHGVLNQGNYFLGAGSSLKYVGANIATIGPDANVILDNFSAGTTGSFLNGGVDALSGSLTTNYGGLTAQFGATLNLGQTLANVATDATGIGALLQVADESTVTINGDLNTSSTTNNPSTSSTSSVFLSGGSSLTVNNLNNTATDNGGSGTSPSNGPLAIVQAITGSTLQVNGNLTNTAVNNDPLGVGTNATAGIAFDSGTGVVTGSLTNQVNSLANAGSNTSGGFAQIFLDNGSSLAVTGDAFNMVNNAATSGSGGSALISLSGGSTMTVGGNFTNGVANSGNSSFDGSASLTLDGALTSMAITGNLTNSVTDTTGVGGAGGTASVTLTNGAQLAVGGTLFNNAFDNSGGISGFALLSLSDASTVLVTGAVDNTNGAIVLNGGGNFLSATGFSNSGGALTVGTGDTADFRSGAFDTFTNLDSSHKPSGGTLNGGTYNISGIFAYDATIGTGGGQILAMNGANITLNSGGQIVYGGSSGSAGANALAALGTLTDSSLTLNGQTMTITPNGGTFTLDPSSLTLNGSSLTIAGGLDNQAGGSVSLNFSDSASVLHVQGAFNNEAGATVSLNGGGNLLTASGLTNNGTLTVLAGDTANFQGAAFTNLAGGTLTGGTYNIGGTFQYDSASGVINSIGSGTNVTLDAQNGGAALIQAGGSGNALSTLASNAGSLTLNNGITLNTAPGGGSFTNTGTLATGGTGSNKLSVTGSMFNTSPGIVNLSGPSDRITVTGQFTNTGGVTLGSVAANSTSISASSFDNQLGGTITLAGSGAHLGSTGAGGNEGTITLLGSNGNVSAAGDFTNAASGLVILEGTGDLFNAGGDFDNAGTVTLGANEGLDATGDYVQSGGITTVESNATLTAVNFDLNGGTLAGGGAVDANVVNNGGTLSPGDPQTIDVNGSYTQGLAGIMNLDLAGPGSYDQVDVSGNLSLAGTLDLTLEPGFDAAIGDIFDIITFTGSETGNFTTFNDPTFDNGTLTFSNPTEVGNDIQIEVTAVAPSSTPEPSTMVLLFCALLFCALPIGWRRFKGHAAADAS